MSSCSTDRNQIVLHTRSKGLPLTATSCPTDRVRHPLHPRARAPSSPIRDSALLVRGRDDFWNFESEQSPEGDPHPDAVARHGAVIDRQLRILYAGAQARGALNPNRQNANP